MALFNENLSHANLNDLWTLEERLTVEFPLNMLPHYSIISAQYWNYLSWKNSNYLERLIYVSSNITVTDSKGAA